MKFGFSGAYRPMSSGVKASGGGAGGGGRTYKLTISGQINDEYTLANESPISWNAENNGGSGWYNTTITFSEETETTIYAWGAGGGGTKRTGSQTGGGGGYATGTYTFAPGNAYGVIIGGAGEGGNQSPSDNNQYNGYNTRAGNAGANSNSNNDGAGGGGLTGIFLSNSISTGQAIIIAGGGGGGSGDTAYGGGGGGSSGEQASNCCSRGGGGGSQSGGGSNGNAGSNACCSGAMRGGTGGNQGAGGGGGYYGGGGGGSSGPGAGGGGSGYIGRVSQGSWSNGSRGGNAASQGSPYFPSTNVGRGGNSGGRGGGGLLVIVPKNLQTGGGGGGSKGGSENNPADSARQAASEGHTGSTVWLTVHGTALEMEYDASDRFGSGHPGWAKFDDSFFGSNYQNIPYTKYGSPQSMIPAFHNSSADSTSDSTISSGHHRIGREQNHQGGNSLSTIRIGLPKLTRVKYNASYQAGGWHTADFGNFNQNFSGIINNSPYENNGSGYWAVIWSGSSGSWSSDMHVIDPGNLGSGNNSHSANYGPNGFGGETSNDPWIIWGTTDAYGEYRYTNDWTLWVH